MKKHPQITREEFENSATKKLQKVVTKAKKIREHLRKLEKDVADKETKIKDYQNTFSEMENQLVKIQAILYAKGST
jgi:uncharacterized protein YlxW (UPF0749 family)